MLHASSSLNSDTPRETSSPLKEMSRYDDNSTFEENL